LQPPDVSVFGPMKQCWRSRIIEHIQQNVGKVNSTELLGEVFMPVL